MDKHLRVTFTRNEVRVRQRDFFLIPRCLSAVRNAKGGSVICSTVVSQGIKVVPCRILNPVYRSPPLPSGKIGFFPRGGEGKGGLYTGYMSKEKRRWKKALPTFKLKVMDQCRFRQINSQRLRGTTAMTTLSAPQYFSRLVNLLQYKNNCTNLSGEKENTEKFSGVYIFGE